jgi:hypothetical protein
MVGDGPEPSVLSRIYSGEVEAARSSPFPDSLAAALASFILSRCYVAGDGGTINSAEALRKTAVPSDTGYSRSRRLFVRRKTASKIKWTRRRSQRRGNVIGFGAPRAEIQSPRIPGNYMDQITWLLMARPRPAT